MPIIEQKANEGSPFALAAMQEFWDYTVDHDFGEDLDHCCRFYQRLARAFISSMKLNELRGDPSALSEESRLKPWGHGLSDLPVGRWDGDNKKPSNNPYLAPLQRDKPHLFINPGTLARFIGTCIDNGSQDLILKLCFKILSEIETLPWYEFRPIWLPFLHQLIHQLEMAGVTLDTPRYQQITGAILEAFLDNYVRHEPAKSPMRNLCREPVSCRCRACIQLSEFLASPSKGGAWFTVTGDELRHMELMINSHHVDCAMTTSRSRGQLTLSVMKTNSGKTEERDQWKRRAHVAKKVLERFDAEKLKTLLGGTDKYNSMIEMSHLRDKSENTLAARQQPRPIIPAITNSSFARYDLVSPNSTAPAALPGQVAGVRRARDDDDQGGRNVRRRR